MSIMSCYKMMIVAMKDHGLMPTLHLAACLPKAMRLHSISSTELDLSIRHCT